MKHAAPAEHGGDVLASLVRTIVPLIIGVVVAKFGLRIDDDTTAEMVTALSAAVYYIVVRLLEVFASSRFGWLLGYGTAPVYPTKESP